jgi:deoxyribodipyrimidine photo-lyase
MPRDSSLLSTEATRAAGLARLHDFLPRAGRAYAAERNDDRGPGRHDNVSGLSPWLRHRLVTEEDVLREVLRQHSPQAAAKFIEEVCWRAYFKGYLEQRPTIWQDYCAQLPRLRAVQQSLPVLREALATATEGRTGIDCFDAWVQELRTSGYLHNHARMWFASIWIFTLRLPWQLGADFTLRHFLDGDPASNTLSWRWVGGLHTRGKHYVATVDNIVRCTGGRFAPRGLAVDPPCLTEDAEHALRRLASPGLPDPEQRSVLLLTEEDLHAESLAGLVDLDLRAVAAPVAATAADLSPLAAAFRVKALADGLSRAVAHCPRPVHRLADLSATSLLGLAQTCGVQQIITAWAPVGPVADALEAAAPRLQAQGVRLVQLRRDYDSTAWPHATRSFFQLRERIPSLLPAL